MKLYCVSKQENGTLIVDEVEAIDKEAQYWLGKEVEGFGFKKRIFKRKTQVAFTPQDAIKQYVEEREKKILDNSVSTQIMQEEIDMAKELQV